MVDNATLAFNRSDALTVANDISGTGALSQVGAGTTILTGTNTYTGGTTISAGTLQVGNGGTTGTLGSGAVVDNATLAFNRSDAVTYAGVISGTGALTQAGAGTTILTGSNSYTGGTTISAGTLQIGGGGTTGSLVGNVTDNAVLAFNRSDNVDFSGAISGTGGLTKHGAGALTLSGTNTYSGATSVKAGALFVNGRLGKTTVSVDGGAMLGGIGTIAGSVNIASGGRLAPGVFRGTLTTGSLNPGVSALMTDGGNLTAGRSATAGVSSESGFGTLNIGGNLRLDGGSQYGVSVDAAGHNSLLVVSGTAAINNAVVAVDAQPGDYSRVTRYAVLQADQRPHRNSGGDKHRGDARAVADENQHDALHDDLANRSAAQALRDDGEWRRDWRRVRSIEARRDRRSCESDT